MSTLHIKTRRNTWEVVITCHISGIWSGTTRRQTNGAEGPSTIGASMDKVVQILCRDLEAWERGVGQEKQPRRLPEHRCGDENIVLRDVLPDNAYQHMHFEVKCRMCGLTARGDTPIFAMKNWIEMEAQQ